MSIINTKIHPFPKRLADFKKEHEHKVIVKGVQVDLKKSSQLPKTTYHRTILMELQNKFSEIDSLVKLIDEVEKDIHLKDEAKHDKIDLISNQINKLANGQKIEGWKTYDNNIIINDYTINIKNDINKKISYTKLNAALLKNFFFDNMEEFAFNQKENLIKKGISQNAPLTRWYSIYQTPSASTLDISSEERETSTNQNNITTTEKKSISEEDMREFRKAAEEIKNFIGGETIATTSYTPPEYLAITQTKVRTITDRINAYMNESNTVEGTAGFFNDFDQVEAFQDDKAKIFAVFQKFNDSDKSINKPALQNYLEDIQKETLQNISTALQRIENQYGSIMNFCNNLKAEGKESEIIYSHSNDLQQKKTYTFNEKNELVLKEESVPIEKFTIHLNKTGSICIKMAQPSQNFGNADYGQVLTNITKEGKLKKLLEFIERETNSTFSSPESGSETQSVQQQKQEVSSELQRSGPVSGGNDAVELQVNLGAQTLPNEQSSLQNPGNGVAVTETSKSVAKDSGISIRIKMIISNIMYEQKFNNALKESESNLKRPLKQEEFIELEQKVRAEMEIEKEKKEVEQLADTFIGLPKEGFRPQKEHLMKLKNMENDFERLKVEINNSLSVPQNNKTYNTESDAKSPNSEIAVKTKKPGIIGFFESIIDRLLSIFRKNNQQQARASSIIARQEATSQLNTDNTISKDLLSNSSDRLAHLKQNSINGRKAQLALAFVTNQQGFDKAFAGALDELKKYNSAGEKNNN